MPGYSKSILAVGNQDDKYICIHCNLLLRDPHQSYCGHRLCKTCIDELTRETGTHECPICGSDEENSEEQSIIGAETIFRDNGIIREMKILKVSCVNDGCEWKGKFNEYEKHEAKCEFALISCPSGCDEKIKRCDKENHLQNTCCMRDAQCSYCCDHLPFKHMASHLLVCPKALTVCHFCGRNIRREKIKEHVDITNGDCPKKRVPCKYSVIGCAALIELGEEHRHSSDDLQHHLDLIFTEVSKMISFRESFQSDSAGFQELGETVQRHTEILQAIQQQVGMLQRDLRERPQGGATHGNLPNGLHRPDTQLKKLTQSNDEVQNKYTVLEKRVSTYEEIVAILNSQIEKSAEVVEAMRSEARTIKERMTGMERKTKAQDRIIALKDVTLAEQDLRIQSLEMTSYDGILNWKISNFARKRRDAVSGRSPSLYSPYFFTSRCGYKMCVRVYLNGDGMGKGSHVSLFFVIMKGEFDAILRWPFRQKVTLLWIDQNNREHVIDAFRPDPSSSSFKRPTADMNIASGCPLFLPLSELDRGSRALVKDDAAFLRIIVDTSDLS